MTQFGTFTVYPVAEPNATVATTVSASITWPWYRNIAPLAPWVLLGGLLLLKPNRNLRAWAVLLPLLGWWMIGALGYRYSYAYGFADVVYPLAFCTAHGTAVLWAASHWIGRIPHNIVRFLVAILIMYFTFVAWSLVDGYFFRGILMEPALSMGAVLIAFGAAQFLACRRRYHPIAFGVWFLAIVAPLTVVTSGFQYIWISYTYGSGIAVVAMALFWSAYGLALWLLLMSFMALVWFNREYRARFAPILHIPLEDVSAEATENRASSGARTVEYAP